MGFNKKVLSKAVSELGKAKAPAKPKRQTIDLSNVDLTPKKGK